MKNIINTFTISIITTKFITWKFRDDDSLFATNDGIVKFANKGKKRKIVSVIPN